MKKLLLIPLLGLLFSSIPTITTKNTYQAKGETPILDVNDKFNVSQTSITGTCSSSTPSVMLYKEKADSTTSVTMSFSLSMLANNSGGVIFGVRDNKEPIKNGYFSLTYSDNQFTLFRYLLGSLGQTTHKYSYSYSEGMNVQLDLKSDSRILLVVNGATVIDMFDYDYQGGYFGYFVDKGTVTYNNYAADVVHNEIAISNISVSNTNLIYIPYLFGYDIPDRDLGSFDITLTPKEGYTLYIDGEQKNSKHIDINSDTRVIVLAKNGEKETEYLFNFRRGYNDSIRPNYHKSIEKGFVNDPNGLVYDRMTDLYHLFYQYTKALDSDVLGNKNVPGDGSTTEFTRYWAHSISKDMVHWFDMPIAIYSYDEGQIFSGTCIVDENNTSGLFSDNPLESRLCAIYTHYNGAKWKFPINMSISKDWGVSWETYGTIFNGSSSEYGDYRDPQVFWFQDDEVNPEGCWMMVFGGWTPLVLLTSSNLTKWTFNSKIKGLDGEYLVSECPDLFKVKFEDSYKWVVTMGGDFFVVGHFEKEDDKFIFAAETQKTLIYNNVIPSNSSWNKGCTYAGITFKSEKYNRPIIMSWMVDYLSDYVDDKYWNGYYTLPIELGLEKINGMFVLTKKPVDELSSLHTDVLVNVENKELLPGENNLLSTVNTPFADVELTIDVGTSKIITFTANKGGSDYYSLIYDVLSQTLTVKYHSSGVSCPWGDFNPSGTFKAPVLLRDNKLSLRILLDGLAVETYANNMQAFMSWFWQKGDAKMSLTIDEGKANIDVLKVTKMGGIY